MSHVSRTLRITLLLVAAAMFALLPAAAGFADDENAPPEHSQADENSQADEHGRDGQEVSAQNRQDDRRANTDDGGGDDGNGNGDDGNGDGQGKPAGAGPSGKNGAEITAQQEDDGRSDEANRGTIKIHGEDWDEESSPPRNEPHPGCDFRISFHGFTAEGATVTFFAWPPTGDQGEIHQDSVVFDTQEARGNEVNAVAAFDLRDELAGFERHPQQGWHVKVEADATDTVGGPKQKVFWLDCPPAEIQEQDVLFGVLVADDEQQEAAKVGEDDVEVLAAQEQPQDISVLSAGQEGQEAAAAAQEEAPAPGELPLTGGAAVATLAGLGLMITSIGLRRLMR